MTIIKKKLVESDGPLQDFRDLYDEHVACPWCKSINTEVANPFGGTVSEIIFRCRDCNNAFGWMKWEMRQPQ
jgi:C4-type Zn-finger protein